MRQSTARPVKYLLPSSPWLPLRIDNIDFVEKIVGIAVGLVVCGVLMPVGINAIANATMPKADPTVVIMFTVLIPIIAIVALILYMLKQ